MLVKMYSKLQGHTHLLQSPQGDVMSMLLMTITEF